MEPARAITQRKKEKLSPSPALSTVLDDQNASIPRSSSRCLLLPPLSAKLSPLSLSLPLHTVAQTAGGSSKNFNRKGGGGGREGGRWLIPICFGLGDRVPMVDAGTGKPPKMIIMSTRNVFFQTFAICKSHFKR